VDVLHDPEAEETAEEVELFMTELNHKSPINATMLHLPRCWHAL
jgi:hypothetical protein